MENVQDELTSLQQWVSGELASSQSNGTGWILLIVNRVFFLFEAFTIFAANSSNATVELKFASPSLINTNFDFNCIFIYFNYLFIINS